MKTKLLLFFLVVLFQQSYSNTALHKIIFSNFENNVVAPVAPILPDLAVCDTNNDGFSVFDLTVQTPLILAAQTGSSSLYDVSYFETMTDATMDGNPISNTTSYFNFSANIQTMYYRITDINTNEFAVGSFLIIINDRPIISNLPNISLCDSDSNPFNGVTSVNLSIQTPVALAQQALSASSYSVTYYTSQANATAGVAPIGNTTNYNASNGQTIWVRCETLATGCYALGSFQVEINSPLQVSTPTPLNVCDTDNQPNNLFTAFDLTVKISEILQGTVGATVAFYPSIANAQTNTNEITNPSSYTNIAPVVQTLGVRVITSYGCISYTTLNIRVLPTPMPNTNPPILAALCENYFSTGQVTVNLTTNAAYITNGDPNVALHYFSNLSDAENNVNEILNPTNATVATNTIYIRVSSTQNIDSTGNGCYIIVLQPLLINPLPNILQPNYPQYSLCDSDQYGVGYELFGLSSQISGILMGQTGMSVTFYPSLSDAQNSTNVITNLNYLNSQIYSQTLGIRVTNVITGCFSISTMDIVVQPLSIPNIVSNTGSNELYVDESNVVIQPLLLDSQVTVNYSYQWYLDGVLIANATNSTFLVDTASSNNDDRNYTVYVENLTSACSALSSSFLVTQVVSILPPTGLVIQTFTQGQTLADIVVNGTAVQWYSSASGTTPLPLNTPLVDGVTYYATQTINGVQSLARLAVTVTVALGINDTKELAVLMAPNPVKNAFTIQSKIILKSVVLYNLLGQKVFEKEYNDATLTIDISNFTKGNYILKVYSEEGEKSLRLLKE